MGTLNIYIDYQASANITEFGTYSLSFNADNLSHSVKTKFDIKELWSIGGETSSIAFDFLVFSMLVYNVDRAINRHKYSDDGWLRKLDVNNIPAVHEDTMNAAANLFSRAINFLTGDKWKFNFVHIDAYQYSPNVTILDTTEYEKVSLFSGGLDSLIGFVDGAYTLHEGKKILLISHVEQGKEGHDQSRILNKCSIVGHPYNGRYTRIGVSAGLRPKTWVNNPGAEGTFRSRSLLFFAMGLYAAYHISVDMPLIVPENGTISINIPLDQGRRSSCSTRTTHPTFIKRLKEALQAIGIVNKLINPYKFKSKADMMIDTFSNNDKKRILSELYDDSCSCAKRSHKKWWDRRENVLHCGKCLPCIYRRVALDAVGLDDPEKVGINIFNSSYFIITNYAQESSRDVRSLLYFLKNRCTREIIAQELRLNGVSDEDGLQEYVNLGIHSYEQVLDWIRRKGTPTIKNMAGL
jgi:hypothetical protein